jgi:hypothetical protein
LSDELDDAFALIDSLPKHRAQVAAFGSKNILPDWLITQEGKRVGHKLPGTAQLPADGRNKNERAG